MSKHTPGPWIAAYDHPDEKFRHQISYIRQKGSSSSVELAMVYCTHDPEQAANADLIAAAPDLLEVLTHILESDMAHREEDEGQQCAILNRARAIIAKVEGR